MAKFTLKSAEFRREREAGWRDLEGLVAKAEKQGLRGLTPDELLRLPGLYRATLSGLSVARAISLDRAVLGYLESLAARAYICVYGPQKRLGAALAEFFTERFPAAVRQARWAVLLSTLILLLGCVTSFGLTMANEDWYYSFVSEGMAGDRTPTSTTAGLRDALYEEEHDPAGLTLFASFLFSNNTRVGLFCFALGFALGIPTAILLFQTGLMLGAFLALYHARGLGPDLLAWLAVHGTTEILALLLCGGAGLMLAGGILLPGPQGRLANLARAGRSAAEIAMGAILLFFVAGLLEGFARQLITDASLRALIGIAALLWWSVYFIGRRTRPISKGQGGGG